MLVCADWLRADWCVRAGYTLHVLPDGTRVARRDDLTVPLPAVCGHVDCPPHPTARIESSTAANRKAAA